MQIPVVVEALSSGQFRAQVLQPSMAIAEGSTSDEALAKLREQLNQEVASGKQVVMLDVPAKETNPFLAMAGWLKGDPLYDEWQAAIQEYRRERDIEDGIDTPDRP